MNSSLYVVPFLSAKKKDISNELYIERYIVLNAAFNRVEEETGKRPHYKENDKMYAYKINENICSYLDFLKRYACYMILHGRPPAIPGQSEPDDAYRVIKIYKDHFLNGKDLAFKHLVLPEYPNSYYLPLDFHMPVIIEEDMHLAILREHFPKNSYKVNVKREPIVVSSLIRLISELDELDEMVNALRNPIDKHDTFYEEKRILIELYKAANFAIEKNQVMLWQEKSKLG